MVTSLMVKWLNDIAGAGIISQIRILISRFISAINNPIIPHYPGILHLLFGAFFHLPHVEKLSDETT